VRRNVDFWFFVPDDLASSATATQLGWGIWTFIEITNYHSF
jgi:hypothetical protein